MLERTTQEWIDVLRQNRLPCGPIQTVGQVCEDPQVLAREMIVSLNHPKAGSIRVTGLPIKLSHTPGEVYAPPPMLGQHTFEVLQDWLGLGDGEVEALQQQGVI
jgi:crotonobetainyl-CoA:carnitine CoA-transferase CaiB-like acyl-CoA transferase